MDRTLTLAGNLVMVLAGGCFLFLLGSIFGATLEAAEQLGELGALIGLGGLMKSH